MYLFCKRNTEILLLICGVLVLIPILFSCGGGGYDAPETTQTDVLITPQILKDWVAKGKVNGTGYDRVVILDVTSQTDYSAGHIAGAFFVNGTSDISQTRNEGIMYDINMVPSGSAMDALIQKYGIDGNTTVVFTSATSTSVNPSIYTSVGRAYFTFRYWGFPKNRLKVLNGLNKAYAMLYASEITTAIPAVIPSSYSVKNNPSFGGDLRASLADMINVADGTVSGARAIDGRGGDGAGVGSTFSYDGDPKKTAGVFTPNAPGITKDYVAFEGRIRGAIALQYDTLFRAVDQDADGTTDYREYLPDANLATAFANAGLGAAEVPYVHCRTGVIASALFVALEQIDRSTVLYDASWSQWGQLAGIENGGYLANDSPWRTDNARSEAINYNVDDLLSGEGIENPADGGTFNSYDIYLNRIEQEDEAYYNSGGGAGGGTAPGY